MSYHTDSAAKERTMVRNERKAMGSNIHKQSVLLSLLFSFPFTRLRECHLRAYQFVPPLSTILTPSHPLARGYAPPKPCAGYWIVGNAKTATFSTVLFVLHKPLSNHAVRMGTWELNFGDDKEKQPEEEVVGVD
jgi:hypothetical protein